MIPDLLTDQLKLVDNIQTRTFFVVDKQLDEDILRNALDRLIRDHRRKLGARLFKRPRDGVLEWHLPKTFDEKYVLFRWSSKEYSHSIDKTGFPKTTPPEQVLFYSLPQRLSTSGSDHQTGHISERMSQRRLCSMCICLHLPMIPKSLLLVVHTRLGTSTEWRTL